MLMLGASSAQAQKLVVKEGEIDCGKVEYFKPATATFKIKNKGSKHMRIDDVRVSCGCLKADYPKDEIAGGGEFTVRLTYDARQLGHFFKEAAIYCNGSDKPVYLSMKGIVVEEVTDFTGEFPFKIGNLRIDKRDLEFDDVNKGDMPEIELHVINEGTTVLEPNLMHLPPYLEATSSVQYLRPDHQGKITVRLNSNKLHDYGVTETSIYLANKLGEKVSNDNEMTVSAVLLPQFAQMSDFERLNAPVISLSKNDITVDFSQKNKVTEEVEIVNNG